MHLTMHMVSCSVHYTMTKGADMTASTKTNPTRTTGAQTDLDTTNPAAADPTGRVVVIAQVYRDGEEAYSIAACDDREVSA